MASQPDYYYHWGHWIPQYDFFYNRKGQCIIQHLLHLELLQEEFPQLMQAYQLEKVQLPQHQVKARGEQLMDVHNLTLATMKLIEVVYERDFELGGYTMLSSKFANNDVELTTLPD